MYNLAGVGKVPVQDDVWLNWVCQCPLAWAEVVTSHAWLRPKNPTHLNLKPVYIT